MDSKKKRTLKEALAGYSFILPNILGFLLFTLFPVIFSLVLSFMEWDLFGSMKFIGIQNYITLFKDPLFWRFFGNTLVFMIGIPFSMAASLLLALLINQKLKGVMIFRTIFFLPVVSSMVACALLWRWIYNPDFGLLNSFLKLFISPENLPKWLQDPFWAKPAIMLMGIWKGAGYNMLLYLAALQGIPDSYYEAAEVDGANGFQKFLHITVPMLKPTNFFIIIMSVIGAFQAFGEMYVMTQGGPAGATTTIVYYIYNNAFQWFKMGYASAISWFLFAFIFGITILQWKNMGKELNV